MAKNPRRKQQTQLSKKHLDRLHRERRQTRWIIISSAAVIAVVVLVIVYGALYENVLKYKRTVANVNGEKISAEQFRGFTKYYRYSIISSATQTYQFLRMFGNDPSAIQQFAPQLQSYQTQLDAFTAGSSAMDQYVDNLLIRQEAKKRGITVTNDEIEERMKQYLGYFPEGTPTPTQTYMPAPTSTLSPLQISMMQPTPTPTLTVTMVATTTAVVSETTTTPTGSFTATPEATTTPAETPTPTAIPPTLAPTSTPTPYTLEGYQNAYATMVADFNTNYQVPVDVLRLVIEFQMYRERLMKEVLGEVTCSQEQVWAQHILVKDEATAKEVLAKLQSGADWYALAAEYSTDTSNKDKGGDLGWFARGSMVTEFEDAAFALQIGKVSEPVKTQFGYHIIRVLGHENRPLTSTECQTMKDTQFKDWVTKVRGTSDVKIDEFWQTIVPLSPTMPAEIQDVINQINQQSPSGLPQTQP
jgi:peptidyl-prolyl cis-trans isomerase D